LHCATDDVHCATSFENKLQKEKAPVVRPGLWRIDTMKKLATAITSEGIL
jgi:hypothetical protein